ncbi:MAG: succinate dehydrogenase/fumarate reductase cytochrome b subunit [Rikenellaceae bacterium]
MSNLFSSSIGRKLIMSLSGAFLILFLLFHASMNLVAVFSADAYDAICEFLGANWYALAATAVLAAGTIIHFVYAFILTMGNIKARGKERYAVLETPKDVSWASRNMFVLGVIIVCGLLIHLFNFWYNMQLVELMGGHVNSLGTSPVSGAELIAIHFSNPLYCLVYLVWFVAIWFHLTHGFWSAFQSLGWGNQIWLPRLQCIAKLVATVICLAFAVVVVVFYLRSLCGAAC